MSGNETLINSNKAGYSESNLHKQQCIVTPYYGKPDQKTLDIRKLINPKSEYSPCTAKRNAPMRPKSEPVNSQGLISFDKLRKASISPP